jgi:hypothetical protein
MTCDIISTANIGVPINTLCLESLLNCSCTPAACPVRRSIHPRRDRVQPLLRSLCAGVSEAELVPAVSGLLSGSAAVRATALAALPHVPTLAEGVAPESEEVTAVLALSRHDVNEDNAAAAEALWQQVRDTHRGRAG